MSAVITWTIEWMQCIPQDGSYTDVVINAGWRCTGTQPSDNPEKPYFGTIFGSCTFLQPAESGTFTPYADLTQDQVLGWCWASGVDQAATEAAVQGQIDSQINPPVITPPLPWVA